MRESPQSPALGRRRALGSLALAACVGGTGTAFGQPAAPAGPAVISRRARTRLILLGTKGGPRVGGERANPANLLMVGDVPYVIDCGYGVARQMVQAGVPLQSLRTIFITH